MTQGIIKFYFGRKAYHILHTVIYAYRLLHREIIIHQIIVAEKEVAVFHKINNHRKRRTAYNLDRKCVATVLTYQPLFIRRVYGVLRTSTMASETPIYRFPFCIVSR